MPPPRRCRPRALSAPRRFLAATTRREPGLPRTHADSATATPRNLAALFHAADALGICPSELSPLGEPCRLPTALCFLAGSTSTEESGAKVPVISDRFPPCADPEPRLGPPCEDRETRQRDREARAPSIVISGRLSSVRVAPPTDLDDQPELPGSPAYGRVARFEALLPPRVRSRGRPHSRTGLRSCSSTTFRADALLGFCPFRACSTTTSGPVDCETARREPDDLGRPRPAPGQRSTALRS